jgi:hypothetical protein
MWADGGNLYLKVTTTASGRRNASWVFRYAAIESDAEREQRKAEGARSFRAGGRHHLGVPGAIIPEPGARSFRIAGRHRPESAPLFIDWWNPRPYM